MNRYPQTRIDRVDGTTTVTGKCTFIAQEYTCTVPTQELERFLSGVHAQTAMPSVSPDDREFLISGISPAGWKKAFG